MIYLVTIRDRRRPPDRWAVAQFVEMTKAEAKQVAMLLDHGVKTAGITFWEVQESQEDYNELLSFDEFVDLLEDRYRIIGINPRKRWRP